MASAGVPKGVVPPATPSFATLRAASRFPASPIMSLPCVILQSSEPPCQSRTAAPLDQKVRYDLYERRYRVSDAARKLLSEVANRAVSCKPLKGFNEASLFCLQRSLVEILHSIAGESLFVFWKGEGCSDFSPEYRETFTLPPLCAARSRTRAS